MHSIYVEEHVVAMQETRRCGIETVPKIKNVMSWSTCDVIGGIVRVGFFLSKRMLHFSYVKFLARYAGWRFTWVASHTYLLFNIFLQKIYDYVDDLMVKSIGIDVPYIVQVCTQIV